MSDRPVTDEELGDWTLWFTAPSHEIRVLRDALKAGAAEIHRLRELLHPWYGPCDAMDRDGGCVECGKVARWSWPQDTAEWVVPFGKLRDMEEENNQLRAQRNKLADALLMIRLDVEKHQEFEDPEEQLDSIHRRVIAALADPTEDPEP